MPIIPRYKQFYSNEAQIRNTLHAQVLAKFRPDRINWPKEPWTPSTPLDRHLKELRDGV
jgi:hypothetical protein